MPCEEDCRTAGFGKTERPVGWEGNGELVMMGLVRLRHQPQRCPRRNLARLQPARRHGKPHRRTQARPGRRRFLPARVLRHRSCFPGRLAAVQPTERVSARRRPARLPRTGHPAHPGVHLWRHPGTGGTTIGAPPVAKLGWVENTKPADRQNLKLGNPNFAEVGFCCSYLKPQSSSPPIPYPWKGGSLRLNFGIQANWSNTFGAKNSGF